MKFAYFGTGDFSLAVLCGLKEAGYSPSLIVCGEDKPVGRKRVMTTPVVKQWGESMEISVLQPNKVSEAKESLLGFDFFVLASYGKILPRSILDLPKHGTFNVHPSLLPKYRGASPLQSAILNEEGTGVSIILLTDKMDAGPVLKQEKTEIAWPPYYKHLENETALQGARMLSEIIPQLGSLTPVEQDHDKATYCTKIQKGDGYLDLTDLPEKNLRKIRAYSEWPGAYYMVQRGKRTIRVVVTEAHLEDGKLVFDRVTPEGSQNMEYATFARGLK